MNKPQPIKIYETVEHGYEMFTIQVMQKRYHSDFRGMLETIGNITFQRAIGETEWYGMRFRLDTGEIKVINDFYKIIKIVRDVCDYRSQPNDVINAINGDKMFFLNSETFSEKEKGLYCFDVMQKEKETIYARLVAIDAKDAMKKLARIQKKRSHYSDLYIGKSFRIE